MMRQQLFLGSFALILASCETGPITTGGDFDPLIAPGSGHAAVVSSRGYEAGSFVRASMDAAFFSTRPRGNADADKQIPANTQMKVISDDGTYVKVELDSGEVGFVPSVLVSDDRAVTTQADISPDAYQVYPPLQGVGGTIPADDSIPVIPPGIDPEAPATDVDELAIPDAPPIPLEEEPVIPPSEPTPLPPGNEVE